MSGIKSSTCSFVHTCVGVCKCQLVQPLCSSVSSCTYRFTVPCIAVCFLLCTGLLAKKAVEAGLSVKPYIKTSLSPGSGVVTYYLRDSGVTPYLQQLGWVPTRAFRVLSCGMRGYMRWDSEVRVGLLRQQLDFRIQISSRNNKNGFEMQF